MNEFNELTQKLIRFRNERDWEQFHNPKDLALALSIEAAELLELFLWKKHEEVNVNKLKDEIADVQIYLLFLAEKYGFNMNELVLEKMQKNSANYPIGKAKGTAKKYNEL